jgi:hypothetical protein
MCLRLEAGAGVQIGGRGCPAKAFFSPRDVSDGKIAFGTISFGTLAFLGSMR